MDGGVSTIPQSGDISIQELAAQLVPEGCRFLIVDRSSLPNDRSLRDAWILDAETGAVAIDPAKAAQIANPVPVSVTMEQARIELFACGILEAVEGLIALMPGEDGDIARIRWQSAPRLNRDDALLLMMADQLSLTSVQVDQMFIRASAR